jgi:hypothetical protein
MNTNEWLAAATADAERRGLHDLVPLLQTLARSTAALREADRLARAEAEGSVPSSGEGREQPE